MIGLALGVLMISIAYFAGWPDLLSIGAPVSIISLGTLFIFYAVLPLARLNDQIAEDSTIPWVGKLKFKSWRLAFVPVMGLAVLIVVGLMRTHF